MRLFLLSLVLFLEAVSGCYAQNDAGTLKGVYGPPPSSAGRLGGVFVPPQSAPLPSLPSTVTAPDYEAERGPSVTLPGDVAVGRALPDDVNPAPIPGRPGYGRAVVNGSSAIIDLGSNRIVEYSQ